MDWVNPVEWLAWVYGKVFQRHVLVGGIFVVALFGALGLLLWIRAVDKYNEEHITPKMEAAKTNDSAPNGAAPLPVAQPKEEVGGPSDTTSIGDSIAVEVRRAKPAVEFSFQTNGAKRQKIVSSVIPEVIQLEPKPTGVKEIDLPIDVPITGGLITVLKFGKENSHGYMLFDTHSLPRGTAVRGEIISYREATEPTGKQQGKLSSPLKPQQQQTVVSAPNGIAIGGGTVNNPTVNNYGPPPVNFHAEAKEVTSSDNAFQFEKQVTISVDQSYSPVSLGFLCDVDVERVQAYGVQYNGRSGTDANNKKLAFVYFDSPPIVPNNPLVISLWSTKYLNVVRVAPAQFNH